MKQITVRRRLLGLAVPVLMLAGGSVLGPLSPFASAQTATAIPTQQVQSGGSGGFTFTVPAKKNAKTISFSVSGLPVGVTSLVHKIGDPTPATRNSGPGRYQLDIFVPASVGATASTITFSLITTYGGRTTATPLGLNIVAPTPPPAPPAPAPTSAPTTLPKAPVTSPSTTFVPNNNAFELLGDMTDRTIGINQSTSYGLTVNRSRLFTGAVTFTVGGLPAGVTANFAPNPTTQSTNLYLGTTDATPDGRYNITVIAAGGGTVRNAILGLTVARPADFQLGLPGTVVMNAGSTLNVGIAYASPRGTNPFVTYAVSGLPSGTTATFSPNPSNGIVTMVIVAGSTTAPGTYALTVSGTSASTTRTYTTSLVINNAAPGFGLAAQPASLSVTKGTSGSVAVTMTPTGGFSSAITYTVTGLPTGVTTTATATGSVTTFTLPVGSTATPGTYPITITGTSGILSASVTVSLTVVAAAA
jgi:hypothetical protein